MAPQNQNTLTLYSSATCPAGVRAAQWLQEQKLPFVVQDYDQLPQSEQHTVRLAIREFVQNDAAPIYLPFLMAGTLPVAVGFTPAIWQSTLRKHSGSL